MKWVRDRSRVVGIQGSLIPRGLPLPFPFCPHLRPSFPGPPRPHPRPRSIPSLHLIWLPPAALSPLYTSAETFRTNHDGGKRSCDCKYLVRVILSDSPLGKTLGMPSPYRVSDPGNQRYPHLHRGYVCQTPGSDSHFSSVPTVPSQLACFRDQGVSTKRALRMYR